MSAAYFQNDDGSIRDFTDAEIAEMEIETYDIEHGGFPTHTRGPDGATLKATYFCKYDMFERFHCYMIGAAKDYTDSGTQRISRMLPQTWPGKPQIAAIKLDSATGHNFVADTDDDDLKVPTYTHMKCVFTFQQLPYALREDAEVMASGAEKNRYVQVMPSKGETSYLGLPGGIMEYNVNGGAAGPPPTPVPHTKPIPYPLGFPVPTLTISRKWHRVPLACWGEGTPLFARVYGDQANGKKPFVGTVNVDTLFGYPAGYLLYLGVEEEIEYDSLGDATAWTLTHTWKAATLAPHLFLYFFSSLAADAAANAWYLATKRGASWSTIETIPDETGLFNGRQHALLWNVN